MNVLYKNNRFVLCNKHALLTILSMSATFECMKKSKYYDNLKPLLKKEFFNSKQARQHGVPSRMLSYFYKIGILEKIGRGIYRSTESSTNIPFDLEDLFITAKSIKNGVICLLSALHYYGYSDQIMREYWIAIPNKQWPSKRSNVRIIRMRNLTLGLSKIKIDNFVVKIFDRERTILDCFKCFDKEIAITALKDYLKDEKKDLNKLYKYSEKLKININSYILALTV
jgi:predicted transcriptional regulator of viral defense system